MSKVYQSGLQKHGKMMKSREIAKIIIKACRKEGKTASRFERSRQRLLGCGVMMSIGKDISESGKTFPLGNGSRVTLIK